MVNNKIEILAKIFNSPEIMKKYRGLTFTLNSEEIITVRSYFVEHVLSAVNIFSPINFKHE